MHRLGLLVLPAVLLAACSSSSTGYGCTGRTCKVQFQGTGQVDLSKALDAGATVSFLRRDGRRAVVRIGSQPATLILGSARTVGRFSVTLTAIGGDDASLRISG